MQNDFRKAAATFSLAVMAYVPFAAVAHAQGAITPVQGATTPAQAADASRLQITPFGAIGDDLAPGGGVGLTYALNPALSLEGEASLGTDAARSSLSVLYALPRWGCCSVYFAAGFGIQRDQDPDYLGLETRKKTEPAVNIGAGFTVPVAERFGYRFDFRWYNPDNEWPESWRIYNGIVVEWRRQ